MTIQTDNITPVHTDAVVPFQIEGMDIRGRIVRLGTSVNTILRRHNYPDPVARLLGEALALTTMLGTMLKYEGIFTLQAKGDGPVAFIVADFASARGTDNQPTSGGNIRGYAQFDKAATEALIASKGSENVGLSDLLGKGYLALTIDQGTETDRYQGVVELEGGNLTSCALGYFRNSEQLPTELKLMCETVLQPDGDNFWCASAIMIQHLPGTANQTQEDKEMVAENWRHAGILMASLRNDEMCDPSLPLQEVLFRLYHESGVRVFEPVHLDAGCRCQTKPLDRILTTFPRQDLIDMAKDGKISMTCEFCTRTYVFNLADILPDN